MIEHDPHAETREPDLLTLAERLRELGYDVELSPPDDSPAPAITARRDLADRAILLALDAGGRFRATLTWAVGEWPSRDEIAGVPVRVVDAVSRAVTVTGRAATPFQILDVVAGLGAIAPWASAANDGATPDVSI